MPLLFFLIALFYSMAGFGGGSSYLAVLALSGKPLDEVATLALMCNLGATAFGVINFGRSGYISLRQAMPFLAGSIPAAFLGGSLRIDGNMHLLLLAGSLSLAAVHLFTGVHQENDRSDREWSSQARGIGSVLIGAGLGLLSGIVGIGGGIFLAPLLYILGWAGAKHIAGLACFFILCNSIAGLSGRWLRLGHVMWEPEVLWLLLAVLCGACLGSLLASKKLMPAGLRLVTAVLVSVVAIRLWVRWFEV